MTPSKVIYKRLGIKFGHELNHLVSETSNMRDFFQM